MMRKWLVAWMVMLASFGGGIPGAAAQFVDQGNSPAENVRNRGARAPGLMVRAGIARHLQGPEITAQEDDPRLRENLLIELIEGFFNLLAGLVLSLPSLLSADTATDTAGGTVITGGVTNIVISELAHDGSLVFVELFNRSPFEIRLDGWRFHDGNNISPPLELKMDPDETKVFQFGGEDQRPFANFIIGFRDFVSGSNGELALYDFSGVTDESQFDQASADADLMIDYLQWNDDNRDRDQALEGIAADAGLWSAFDSIRAPLTATTFRLEAGAEGTKTNTRSHYQVGAFDSNHTLGFPESLAPAAPAGGTESGESSSDGG